MKLEFASGLPDFHPSIGTITVSIAGLMMTLTDEMYDEPALVFNTGYDAPKVLSISKLFESLRFVRVPEPKFVRFPPEVPKDTPLPREAGS